MYLYISTKAGDPVIHRITTDEDIDGGAGEEALIEETAGVEPEPYPAEPLAAVENMEASALEAEADVSGLALLAAVVAEDEEPEPCPDEPLAAEGASATEPVEASASRPEPVIAKESEAARPEPVIAEESGPSGPDPVIAEESCRSRPEPVIAEESCRSRPEPVIAEESGPSRPEPVIAEESGPSRPESKVESGRTLSVRAVARPLVTLEEKLAMSRAKLRAQLLNLCRDMMCAMMFFIT